VTSDEQQRDLKGEAARKGGKNPKGGSETRPHEKASAVIDRRCSGIANRKSAIGNELIPATTYSPTQLPAQYHGPWRA
jgi:hypothetical protein